MSRKFLGVVALAGASLCANIAAAAPYSFIFDMPTFASGSLVGQSSVMEVVVDNGGTSNADESYMFSHITGAYVTVNGVTFGSKDVTSLSTYSLGGTANFLTTDASGYGTLNLNQPDSSYFMIGDGSSMLMLGTGSFQNMYYYDAYAVAGAGEDGIIADLTGEVTERKGLTTAQRATFTSAAAAVSPVPVPASFALLGAGLAGFGVMARKKRKQA